MKPNPFKDIPEDVLIKKYSSPSTSYEESSAIFAYLWEQYRPSIIAQCSCFFSNSTYINYEELLQECALTFVDVLHSYDPVRGKLITALVLPLRHTFTEYIASTYGYSQYDNMIISRIKKMLSENDLSGHENIDFLTALYNQIYRSSPLSSKSLKKHLEYYKTQDLVYLDQYPSEFQTYVEQSSFDSVWQDIDKRATYTIIQNYIEKAEGDDQLLLLFLFGFIPSVKIDGHLYSVHQKRPIKPLRKACFRLFPSLAQYLYDNHCIPDTDAKSLLKFVCDFAKLKH